MKDFNLFKHSISLKLVKKIFLTTIIFEISIAVIFLTLNMLIDQETILYKLFNLDGEKNIPAIFSATQLFLIGFILISLIFLPKNSQSISIPFLLIIGMFFIFLSIDEAFSIHEKITTTFKQFNWVPRFKGNHGIWIIPYLITTLIVFVLFYKNFIRLWNNYREETIIIVFGFTIFITGGVGLEIISYEFLRDGSYPKYYYLLEVVLEELLEMIGISIVLFGVIKLHLLLTKDNFSETQV